MRRDTTDFSRVEFSTSAILFSEKAELKLQPAEAGGICKVNSQPLTRLKLKYHPAEAGGI